MVSGSGRPTKTKQQKTRLSKHENNHRFLNDKQSRPYPHRSITKFHRNKGFSRGGASRWQGA